MKSAWIPHEFNTDLISITVPSIVKKSVYKSSPNQFINISLLHFELKLLQSYEKTWLCPQLQTTNPNHQVYLYWN